MMFKNLSAKAQKQVSKGLDVINQKFQDGLYAEVIQGLVPLLEMFEEDTEFSGMLSTLLETAKRKNDERS